MDQSINTNLPVRIIGIPYAAAAYLTDILSASVFRIHQPLIVMKKKFLLISDHVASVVASARDLQINTHGSECSTQTRAPTG